MKKTKDYLNQAIRKAGSAYRLAEMTGISEQVLSHYKHNRRIMDDYACLKLAEVIGIDPMEIITAANIEREKREHKRKVWEEFSRRMGWAAILLILVLPTRNGYAKHVTDITKNIHYTKLRHRRRQASVLT